MNFIARRLVLVVVKIYVIVTGSFFMISALPGGLEFLIRQRLAQRENIRLTEISEERIERKAEALYSVDISKPLHERYLDYMANLLIRGDLGRSFFFQREVEDILFQVLPWTMLLSAATMFISTTVGLLLGAIVAYFEGGKFDVSTSMLATTLTSIPGYVYAIVLLVVLGFQFGVFPTSGRWGPDVQPGWTIDYAISVAYHAALPILSTSVAGWGGYMLGMRANSISNLESDFVRVAEIRGLGNLTVATRYVGRNSLLPMYTGIMLSLSALFSGSVIIETIFTYKGVGYYTFQALKAKDYPLMMGGFLLLSTALIVSIFIADVTYGLIDPRIDIQGEN